MVLNGIILIKGVYALKPVKDENIDLVVEDIYVKLGIRKIEIKSHPESENTYIFNKNYVIVLNDQNYDGNINLIYHDDRMQYSIYKYSK